MQDIKQTIGRIAETVEKQDRIIAMQKEIIDELYQVILLHVSASDLEPVNRKIIDLAKMQTEE